MIAVLLVAMGITSILVIREMNQEAHQLISLQEQSDIARQAIYAVTSQSHFRAMALITEDDSYNEKIAAAKESFIADLDTLASMGGPGVDRAIDEMRDDQRALRGRGRRGAWRSTKRAISAARSTSTSPPSTRSPTSSRTS